jgi:hypothetical protein
MMNTPIIPGITTAYRGTMILSIEVLSVVEVEVVIGSIAGISVGIIQSDC